MHKDNIIDNYHGRLICDSYRWLENIESEETQEFVRLHNKVTSDYISEYEDFYKIKEEITKYSAFDKGGVPVKKGEYYYFFYKEAAENQPVLYRAKELWGEREVLVNPNELSTEGICAITGFWVNDKKDIIAYGISEKGSDWQTIYFKKMSDGQLLEDKLDWCKFASLCWINEGENVIYTRYPKSYAMHDHRITCHNMVSIHRVGTTQDEDKDIIDGVEESEYSYHLQVTEDERYLIMYKNRPFGEGSVMSMELSDGLEARVDEVRENINLYFSTIVADKEESFQLLGNVNNKLYFLTDYKAENKRIVEIDILNSKEEQWKTIIEENSEVPIETAEFTGSHIVLVNMEHGHHTLLSYELGKVEGKSIELPAMGAIDDIKGCDKEIFVSFSSFFIPTTIYKFDLDSNELKVVWQPQLDIDFDDFITEQVFVTSKDGTRIPMFINRRKDMKLNSQNRTVLYAYGGFNLNRIPEYRAAEIVWTKRGGIYAVANIRGGNEYGEKWHKAGMMHNKQNCFDDFISCGQWLIDNKYTSNKKLAIRGRSNGGLLTASCMVQRPDLYGAVISQVPVIDMLRYHKYTVGRYWIPEYGDAENNREDFLNMIKYSPLHNIKYGSIYPPVLIATGDSDDRVLPCHSYKFAATLEEAMNTKDRVFLRVEKDAGHGQGKPLSKLIDVEVDIYSFLEKVLG